jgi:uncharacterized Zn finger protein
LQIAEHGLTLAGSKAELAAWLSELAAGLGNSTLALQAAVVACQEAPSLSTYRRVQELAGADWPARQAELLAHLRRSDHFDTHGRIDIFLHENLVDDAIATVENHYAGHELVAQVAEAAITQRPDWVIGTARSQAESIMNDGKAAYYYDAVEWLKKARAAYQVADRRPEWLAYLNDLRALHQRKYKLRPLLDQL